MAPPSSMNPYESTAHVPPPLGTIGGLLPLWTWLAVAAGVSFFCTPADPLSMLIALALGLLFFSLGCVVGSNWRPVLRLLPVVIWGVIVVWLSLSTNGWYFATGVAAYSLVSIVAGAWACRSIQHGRVRVLVSFCGGDVVGSFAGIVGTVAGAIIGVLLAKHSVKAHQRSTASVGDECGK